MAFKSTKLGAKLLQLANVLKVRIRLGVQKSATRFLGLSRKAKILLSVILVAVVATVLCFPIILEKTKAPEIVYAFPSDGATEVPADSRIQITFNKKVAKFIAEKSFQITPAVRGAFSWQNDFTLIFTPEEKLLKGQTYSYRFGLPIPQEFGLPFVDARASSFETVGGLRVLSYAPAETAQDPKAPIVVVFDRPIIDISTYDEEVAEQSPIDISPTVEGKGTWLGSSAYKFEPSQPYKDSTTYTVKFKMGLKALDGETILASHDWSFASNYPELLTATPADGKKNVPLSSPISLSFNQPIDTNSLMEVLEVTDSEGRTQTYSVTQDYKAKNTYLVYVSGGLKKATKYHVNLKTGLKPKNGELTSILAKDWFFTAAADPFVTRTYPNNGDANVGDLYSSEIHFSVSMDLASIRNGLVITPRPANFKVTDCGDYCDDDSYYATLTGDFKAETSYTVTLPKTIRSVYGYNMQSDYKYSFTTAPTPASMGIKAADSYFLAYDYNLIPRVAVSVINVSKLNYSLTALSLQEFSKLYRLKYDYDYARSVCGNASYYNCMNWQNYTPTGEKIKDWEVTIAGAKNEKALHIENLTSQNGESLKPGLYFLQIEARENGLRDNAVVMITSSATTLKENGKQAFVWAVDQKTALPLQGHSVKIYKADGSLLKEGQTNQDGVFQTETNHGESDIFATVSKGEGFSIVASNFDIGISRYDYGNYGYRGDDDEYKLYGYTDLPLYRPGETILFKGMLKNAQGNAYMGTAGKSVTVTITNSQGTTVYSENFTTDGEGTFSGQYATATQIPTGYYTLGLNYLSKYYYAYSFQIEEYRKPEFYLNIAPDKESYTKGQTNYVTISTAYYFGAPIAGREIKYQIKTRDTIFSWDKNPYYDFAELDQINYYWDVYNPADSYQSGEVVSEGKGVTDADGILRIRLPFALAKTGAQKLVVEAVVEDVNNQAVAASKEITMHPANFYIGLKPKNYVYSDKERVEIDVVTVGHDGVEVGEKKIDAKIYRRIWNTIKEKDPDTGNYFYSYKPTDILVKEKSLFTEKSGYGVLTFEAEEGGIYRIVARSADAFGNRVSSSTTVWVSGDGYETMRANNDRINIVTDKAEYQVGETAKVFADSPYKETSKSLVTIERDGILKYFLAETGGGSKAFDIKITPELFPNSYISVLVPKAGRSQESPAEFKLGYAPIKVKDDNKQLEVKIKTDKEKYLPRDKVVVEVFTKTKSGLPVGADISLAVTDQAVWDMSTQRPADIFDHFYSDKPLTVNTSNLLTVSVDRINLSLDKGSKGGGGWERDDRFFETTRTKFLNTAYWLPSVKTNSAGYAKLEFELPDNLTTWKIESKAHTSAGQVGQGETKTATTKDYVLRPFVSRFFSTGDEVKIGAIFTNNSDQTRDINISLEGSGFEIKSTGFSVTRTFKPKEQRKILFDSVITSTESVSLKTTARYAGRVLDGVEISVPVKNHYAKQASASFGEIKSSTTERLNIPDTVVLDHGQVDLSVFPNPILQSLSAYGYMGTYPYDCTEQVSSRLLSALSLYKIQKAYSTDIIFTYSQKLLSDRIYREIQTLTSRQLDDGGWAWWEANDRWVIKSDPLISAYAYDVLNQAKTLGFTVPETTLNKAKNYLINRQSATEKDYNLLSYLLYSVGKDHANNYAVETLLNNKRFLSIEAKTYLADYLYGLGGGQNIKNANTLKYEILALAKTSDTLVNWEEPSEQYDFYGSDVSTTAGVVKLLSKYDQNHPYVDKALLYLSQKKQNDNFWISTKTTAKVLETAAARLSDKKNRFYSNKFKVFLDTAEVLAGEYTKDNLFQAFIKAIPIKDIKQNGYTDVKFEKSGSGALFYQVTYKYLLRDKYYKPTENGLTLIRKFVDDTGNSVDLSKLKEKDMFWVKLTVVAPSTRNNVLIEDYLPAGLESINMNLVGSKILAGNKPKELAAQECYGCRYGDYTRTEYKDDVTAFFAGTLYPGVYEYSYKVRATTPGIYIYPPASAYEMYNPNIFGNSSGFEVKIAEN